MSLFEESVVAAENALAAAEAAKAKADHDQEAMVMMEQEIFNLEEALRACKNSVVHYDAVIQNGEDLNKALLEIGPYKNIKVEGVFYTSMKPLSGQKIYGPFVLDGETSNASGINLKLSAAKDVRVEDFTVKNFKGKGLVAWTGSVFSNFSVEYCAGNGLGGSFDNQPEVKVLFEDFEVSNCGSLELEGHSAAGAKFTRTGPPGQLLGKGVTLRRGSFDHCAGNGWWFDISCAGDLVENVYSAYNTRSGGRYEISPGPFAIKNIICRSNKVHGLWIVSSAYVEGSRLIFHDNSSKDLGVFEDERAVLNPLELGSSAQGYKLQRIELSGVEAETTYGLEHLAVLLSA